MKQAAEMLQQQITRYENLLEQLHQQQILALREKIARLDDQLKLLALCRRLP